MGKLDPVLFDLPTGITLVSSSHSPIPVERYVLDNGLSILLNEDPSVELLSYQTWIAVGSASEALGKTGLAHLFEHLMFKATHQNQEGVFDRALEEAGGSANAATWLDWTYYYEDIPSPYLERVIALEADRLAGLLLNEEQLEAERKVVMNERRECVEDDPEALIDEKLWHLAFGSHPYGHPTIGWMQDIEGLTLEDCQKFYRTYYAANQVTVVVSGCVDRSTFFRHMIQYYGSLSSQPKPALPALTLPPQTGPIYETLEMTLHAPKVSIGLITYPVTDPKSLALECLDEILNQGDSSRLHRAFVLEREWATAVYSGIPTFKGQGLYELTLELSVDAPVDKAIELVFESLEALITDGFMPGELEKIKRQKELGAYRALQTLQQRAYALGFWEIVSGDYLLGLQRAARLDSITEEDILEIARELLDPSRRFVVIGQPSEDPEVMSNGYES